MAENDHIAVGLGAADSVQGFIEQLGNVPEGHDSFITKLFKTPVELIILEATGGYEFAVASAQQSAGFPFAIINPRQARGFAKAWTIWPKRIALIRGYWRKWLTKSYNRFKLL